MKIEETPYGFYGQSPVEKLKRDINTNNVDAMLNDFDLSFLDLLTTVAERSPADTESREPVTSKSKTESTTKSEKAVEKPKLSLVDSAESSKKSEKTEDNSSTYVEKDLTLLDSELTAIDQQYLKQVVIPNVPILLGSVPFESVFPTGSDGEISYKGFEISPKLAELIEKGYKTGRPIRVELDAQSALVLKIRNGQVSAEFVSSERGTAFAMQQELDQLRNRMLSKNLPVGSLEYKYQDPERSPDKQSEQSEADTLSE